MYCNCYTNEYVTVIYTYVLFTNENKTDIYDYVIINYKKL